VAVDGVSAASKVYDGNNVVDLVGQARAVGLVDGDAVSLVTSNVGTLADANVGTSKPVTVTGFSLRWIVGIELLAATTRHLDCKCESAAFDCGRFECASADV
jgi:hypothetical protein